MRTREKWWCTYTEGNGLNIPNTRACVPGTAGGALHLGTSCLEMFLCGGLLKTERHDIV